MVLGMSPPLSKNIRRSASSSQGHARSHPEYHHRNWRCWKEGQASTSPLCWMLGVELLAFTLEGIDARAWESSRPEIRSRWTWSLVTFPAMVSLLAAGYGSGPGKGSKVLLVGAGPVWAGCGSFPSTKRMQWREHPVPWEVRGLTSMFCMRCCPRGRNLEGTSLGGVLPKVSRSVWSSWNKCTAEVFSVEVGQDLWRPWKHLTEQVAFAHSVSQTARYPAGVSQERPASSAATQISAPVFQPFFPLFPPERSHPLS